MFVLYHMKNVKYWVYFAHSSKPFPISYKKNVWLDIPFPFISLISMEDNHPYRKHEYKYAIFPSLIFTMVERVRGKYREKNANWHLSSDGVALSSKFHRIYRAERTTMNRLYKPWISKRPNFSRIIGTNLSRKTNLGRMITVRTGRVAKYHCWFEYTWF